MTLGTYTKTPSERKRYSIDYDDWLDTDETVTEVAFAVEPAGALEVDASSLAEDGRSIVFFVSGGVDATDYVVTATATTSGGQIKEDQVNFEVAEL